MRSSRAFVASLVALALGWAGGAAYDERPPRPAAHRAGHRVLEGDFHVHTTFSDGLLSPLLVVRQAERRGLDVIAVTEHNTTLPGRIARWWTRATDGPIVVVGEEVTTSRHHVVAIGIEDTISADGSVKDVVREIHRQGGIAIAAHPVARFQPGLEPARHDFDAAEIMHPIAYSSRDPRWRFEDMLAWWESTAPRPTAIGSSDYHFASVLGLCKTLVFVREPADAGSVLEAIHDGRTVVVDRDGVARGDPALVAALAKEPYEQRSSDYAYRGASLGDRVLRLVGLAGVAGLAFVRRRAKATPGNRPAPAA